jgi:hypothetical protein
MIRRSGEDGRQELRLFFCEPNFREFHTSPSLGELGSAPVQTGQDRRRGAKGAGSAYDNALAESFVATLKTELLYRASWPTRQTVRTAIFDYIEGFYDRAC